MTYMGDATFNKNFQTLTLFPITTTTTTIIITLILIIITSLIVDGSTLSFTTFKHDTATTPSSPHHLSNDLKPPPFKPSTGVLVGVLSATFTIFFLILLYVKHCSRGARNNTTNSRTLQRKNSGIDRSVLELLPSFKFCALKGEKDGLECSVCLSRFKDPEVLRLLPKCKHAFHVECLDTWLHAHSTCPLCRCKVDPSDVIEEEDDEDEKSSESDIERGSNDDVSCGGRRESDDVGTTLWSTRSLDGGEHRLKHRIIVSPACSGSQDGVNQRWSDFQSRDVLYLTPDMITWKARGGRGRGRKRHNTNISNINIGVNMKNNGGTNHLRSVSEATGTRNV